MAVVCALAQMQDGVRISLLVWAVHLHWGSGLNVSVHFNISQTLGLAMNLLQAGLKKKKKKTGKVASALWDVTFMS